MTNNEFDVVVIGGGPGGYTAAIRASQLGLSVGLVEKDKLGGICLNWGCIPTKALLKSAEVYNTIQHASEYGIKVSKAEFDFEAVIGRSRKVSEKLSGGIEYLMKKNKVTVIKGTASFLSNETIAVKDSAGKEQQVKSKFFIVATGASSKNIPGFETDENKVWSYRKAMVAESKPASLVVIGSGAIGVEFASFYNHLGTKVTILEAQQRILPNEDEEIAKIAHKSFVARGIEIQTGISLSKFDKSGKKVAIHFKSEGDKKDQVLECDKVLMAIGVKANTEGLGLEKAKVDLDGVLIKTDQYLQTSSANIYAIGDVVKGPWLAHKASHEAMIAAEKIAEKLGKFDARHTKPLKTENIPGCTYCTPQIASIGLTEKKALEAGYEVKVGRFNFGANGKAIASGDTEGLVKVIFDKKTNELLGAHLVGSEVTEMIHSFALAKSFEALSEDFMHTIFPHPSLSEMIHEAVLDSDKRAINS